MPDYERMMLTFAQLAAESHQKQQVQGTIRFLILTGVAAARAGWPAVSTRCHELVCQHSPGHLLSNYDRIEAALRDEEFHPFLKHLERFCSYERAEMLLAELSPGWESDILSHGQTAGERCLSVLSPL